MDSCPTEPPALRSPKCCGLDALYRKLQDAHVELVHELLEHRWGQRAVRFYDPDHHIVEAGEDMAEVVKRFLRGGMTVEQAAGRMDVPPDYIRECMER